MDKGIIKVKISGDRLAELYRLYDGLKYNYECTTGHEYLLRAHISQLRRKMEYLIFKDQAKNTLAFEEPEAMAFVQFWQPGSYKLPPIQALVIQSVFDALDKMVHQQRVLQTYDNRY